MVEVSLLEAGTPVSFRNDLYLAFLGGDPGRVTSQIDFQEFSGRCVSTGPAAHHCLALKLHTFWTVLEVRKKY